MITIKVRLYFQFMRLASFIKMSACLLFDFIHFLSLFWGYRVNNSKFVSINYSIFFKKSNDSCLTFWNLLAFDYLHNVILFTFRNFFPLKFSFLLGWLRKALGSYVPWTLFRQISYTCINPLMNVMNTIGQLWHKAI